MNIIQYTAIFLKEKLVKMVFCSVLFQSNGFEISLPLTNQPTWHSQKQTITLVKISGKTTTKLAIATKQKCRIYATTGNFRDFTFYSHRGKAGAKFSLILKLLVFFWLKLSSNFSDQTFYDSKWNYSKYFLFFLTLTSNGASQNRVPFLTFLNHSFKIFFTSFFCFSL